MKRASFALLVGALILLLISTFQLPDTSAHNDQTATLPGAVSLIDAGRYASLQAAFDALPATGGMVQLPAGVFEISEPLRISANDVCVSGAGGATHIKNINENGQPAIIVAHSEAKLEGNDRQHTLWRVKLTNFRVTGNEKSGAGIAAHNINEVFIDGVTVSYHGGDGILLDYCYEDPRVCDSLITYNGGAGLNLQGCHDIIVSSNQFEENQDALHCFDGFNLCMTGNCLDDHLGHGVIIENTFGSVVSGNMIEECQGKAIILDRDCYGVTLSANVIANDGGGIDLRDANGCSVSANTMTLVQSDALRIGPGSGRIAVGGNSFSNSYVGEGRVHPYTKDLPAAGLVLDGAADVGISGNVFSSLRPKAVSLGKQESRGVLFSNNLLTDADSEHDQLPNALVTDNLSASQ